VKELGTDSEKPEFNPNKKPLLSLYPGWDYSKGYQWGMSIDLQSCIGCNACLVACVAENNIAVVGREEVAREREMHWIRIDQYFGSSLSDQLTAEVRDGTRDPDAIFANPRVYHQPVPCMHCENAPCELVCPVGATVHSPEGINDMVYNRCVGTRYCSNNCPYKVRRFNFFNWFKGSSKWFDLQHNPDVTVRSRGVMEKCTYCVQRTTNTRIAVEKMIVRIEQRQKILRSERNSAPPDRARQIDHELEQLERDRHNEEFRKLEQLQVACQQSCPTGAIQFGHLLPVDVINEIGQRESRLTQVARLKQEPLDYAILEELTTKPRTTYMGRLRNPNPDLEPEAKA
jgi:molybdopterin-containing oxidoreductase family iron-sulfur binding subunit